MLLNHLNISTLSGCGATIAAGLTLQMCVCAQSPTIASSLMANATVLDVDSAPGRLSSAPAPMPKDIGVYSDLDPQVRIENPAWLVQAPSLIIEDTSTRYHLRFIEGVAVAFVIDGHHTDIPVRSLGAQDPDLDGIPTSLDLLMGAKKTVLLATPYHETYRTLRYPNGELPRNEGVCTDVIVRALRNAGYDLQSLIQEDWKRAPHSYPGIQKPDPNIDHRRVRNLLVYFNRHFSLLPANAEQNSQTFLPGDILFFDTMGDVRPEHVGIVSDHLGKSGRPLVINSWTTGYVTAEMDLLASIPVTHRFRVPSVPLDVPATERHLSGLLRRHGLEIPPEHQQLLVVLAPQWTSSYGQLHRYQRSGGNAWVEGGPAFSVRLGARGLAEGRGITVISGIHWSRLDTKQEGDKRSPAGLFLLGTGFGSVAAKRTASLRWPYRQTSPRDVWVDDPLAKEYNTWQTNNDAAKGSGFRSAEALSTYELGLVIRHNDEPSVPGAGSAHFVHSGDLRKATVGCTSLEKGDMRRVLEWLDEGLHPVLLQTAGTLFE